LNDYFFYFVAVCRQLAAIVFPSIISKKSKTEKTLNARYFKYTF